MKTYTILIADDEIANIQVITEAISELGISFKSIKAVNGKILCEMAEKRVPDLIITDWEMPEMNGIEAIKYLKQNEETKDIPVIMCTGIMTTSENLKIAMENGAVDFIKKPIDKIELTARVKSIIKLIDSYSLIKEQNNIIFQERLNYYKDKNDSHQRELTTNALLLVETQEKFKKLVEELRNIIIPNKIEIEKVVSKYQSNSKDKFWQEFELRFEQVHQDFYKTISQSYPDISPSESKLCALLKLNMSTKEIVAITSSTENSVNVARSRIRTKLGLNRDENLVTFLNQV